MNWWAILGAVCGAGILVLQWPNGSPGYLAWGGFLIGFNLALVLATAVEARLG